MIVAAVPKSINFISSTFFGKIRDLFNKTANNKILNVAVGAATTGSTDICLNPSFARCITSCEQELSHIFRLTDKEKKALADRGITLNDDGSLTGKGGRRLEADRTDVWGPSAPQSHEVNRSGWYYEPVNKQQARNDYSRRSWSNRRREGDRLSKVDYAGYLDKPASEYDQGSRRADYLRLRYKGEDDAYQDKDSPESTVMRPYSDDYRKARQQYDDAKRWRDNYQKEIDDMSPDEAELQQKLAAKRERNDRDRAEREASKQRYNDAVAERDKFMADIRAKKGRK